MPMITSYYARWDYIEHDGMVGMRVEVESYDKWRWVEISDPHEFAILVDLLRNEKPVYWNERGWIKTGYSEEPGEEES